MAGLRAVHAKEWYHAQLAAFLYRPNTHLTAFGRDLLGSMEQSAPPGSEALDAAGVPEEDREDFAALMIQRNYRRISQQRKARAGGA